MPVYYCHDCADVLGLLQDYPVQPSIGTTYQQDKYFKHTVPSTQYPLQSVFTSPSTEEYGQYIVDASSAGSVEIDDMGRKNIIFVVGANSGFRYEYGQLKKPLDAVKIVLSSSTGKIHAYPEGSTSFSTQRCAKCGSLIVS